MRVTPARRAAALVLAGWAAHAAPAAEVRWEAESTTNTDLTAAGPYRPATPGETAALSGGQWLNGKVDRPGHFAEYGIAVPEAGRYQLFARKFWQHGPFRWRLDDGPWYRITEARLLDSVELRKQVPLNWAKLGNVDLAAGPHTFRLELIKDARYPWCTVFGLDAFLLTTNACFGCSVTADAPPADAPEWKPRTGDGLDTNGVPVETNTASFGLRIPRTMALLAGSTPAHPNTVRILFYGQSIVASSHVQGPIVAFLRQQYPDARLVCENRAIGGYEAPLLSRTAWQDLYPFYPDLVVFHVYGGEHDGTLEEIFRNIRRFTTAEILTWTDHVDELHVFDAQREAAADCRRKLAEAWGIELADIRPLWQRYLDVQQLPAKALLLDQIHLNANGGALLGRMVTRHFRLAPATTDSRAARVRTLTLDRPQPGVSWEPGSWTLRDGGLVSAGTQPLRIALTGNRVEVVALARGTKPGAATIRLDGQVPSSRPDTYAAGRSSLAPGAWWPVVTRVVVGPHPVAETWTLAFHNVTPDGRHYAFDLRGSVTGADGSGEAGKDFTSTSGRIAIQARDLAVASVSTTLKKPLPAAFEATWKVYSMSRDTWAPGASSDPGRVVPETLVQVWQPGPHVLDIIPAGPEPVGIQALILHDPAAGTPP